MAETPYYINSDDVRLQYVYDCGLLPQPATESDMRIRQMCDLFKKHLLEVLEKQKPIFKLTEAEKKIIILKMQDYVNDILLAMVDLVPPRTEERLKELIKQHVFKIIRSQIRPLKSSNTKILTREEFQEKLLMSKAATTALINDENETLKKKEEEKRQLALKKVAAQKRRIVKEEKIMEDLMTIKPDAMEEKEPVLLHVVITQVTEQEKKRRLALKKAAARKRKNAKKALDVPQNAEITSSIVDKKNAHPTSEEIVPQTVDDGKLSFRRMMTAIDWTLDEDQEEILVLPPKQVETPAQILSYANALKKNTVK